MTALERGCRRRWNNFKCESHDYSRKNPLHPRLPRAGRFRGQTVVAETQAWRRTVTLRGAAECAIALTNDPAITLAPTQFEVPKLDPPGTYQPKDNIIDVELSEYARLCRV